MGTAWAAMVSGSPCPCHGSTSAPAAAPLIWRSPIIMFHLSSGQARNSEEAPCSVWVHGQVSRAACSQAMQNNSLPAPAQSWWPCPVRSFKFPVLDFDQFMSLTKATASEPYLVLNYDSANLIYGSGDWSYSQLLALAQSWLQYIIRMGYKVPPAAHQRAATPPCWPADQLSTRTPGSMHRLGRCCLVLQHDAGRQHNQPVNILPCQSRGLVLWEQQLSAVLPNYVCVPCCREACYK